MSSRGTKRPVSVSDAFRMEEETSFVPKDAKVSRNLGSQSGHPDPLRHDGSISTPVAGLPGSEKCENEAEALAVTRRTSFDHKAEAPAVSRASFDQKAMSVKSASPTSEKRPEKAKQGFFVCWLCKRRFDTYEKFDSHVLYSRLHQETIRQLAGLA
ncbi:ZNF470 [Symbiodinium natans]|uniref:ZNF470 protein n=1 Tax=Symbiodinium natans TaxID=878477 RepID=A0A812S3P2_9DINO|nr:ZNF470 [Symbiodinium natans]